MNPCHFGDFSRTYYGKQNPTQYALLVGFFFSYLNYPEIPEGWLYGHRRSKTEFGITRKEPQPIDELQSLVFKLRI